MPQGHKPFSVGGPNIYRPTFGLAKFKAAKNGKLYYFDLIQQGHVVINFFSLLLLNNKESRLDYDVN